MKLIIIFFISFLSINSIGQFDIGPTTNVRKKIEQFTYGNKLELAKRKTVFVYRNSDKKHLDSLKSAISSVWDFTEIIFVSHEEFTESYHSGYYSFFTIKSLTNISTPSEGHGAYMYTHIYLNLWMWNNGEYLSYCRIELYPSYETVKNLPGAFHMDYFHDNEDVTLYNWNIGYLKNTFQLLNKHFSYAGQHWLFESKVYSDLSRLRQDTLFIPDYSLIKFKKLSGNENDKLSSLELVKNYPYPYKFINVSDLTDKIINSKKSIYYLSYIKSASDKFITIINGKSGDLLYSKYEPNSRNFKASDLKKIAKNIK